MKNKFKSLKYGTIKKYLQFLFNYDGYSYKIDLHFFYIINSYLIQKSNG